MKNFFSLLILACCLALMFSLVTTRRGDRFLPRLLEAVFWAIGICVFLAISQEAAQLLELSRSDGGYARGRPVPSPFSFFVTIGTAVQTYALWRLTKWLRKIESTSEPDQLVARPDKASPSQVATSLPDSASAARSANPDDAELGSVPRTSRKLKISGLSVFLLCAAGLNAFGCLTIYDKSQGGSAILFSLSIGCLIGSISSSFR